MLFAFGITSSVLAQSKAGGGRKREHKNQRRSSWHNGIRPSHSSRGNADAFARGGKNNGVFYRMFHKPYTGAWVYKPTNPGKKQLKEQPHLFSRFRTKNKKYKDGVLAKQNGTRAKSRRRGNAVFHKRRY